MRFGVTCLRNQSPRSGSSPRISSTKATNSGLSFTAPEGDLQIDNTFGAPIKWAQGFDAGIAYFRFYGAYAVRKPNAWARITGLNNVANR